jgi:hypothetical protein
MQNVDIFYGRLVYIMTFWYNIWPFGTVCGHLVYFSRFGMFGLRKMATLLWSPTTRNLCKAVVAFVLCGEPCIDMYAEVGCLAPQ